MCIILTPQFTTYSFHLVAIKTEETGLQYLNYLISLCNLKIGVKKNINKITVNIPLIKKKKTKNKTIIVY